MGAAPALRADTDAGSAHRFRAGDCVYHAPSGDDHIVAFADYETGNLSWVGWPEGLVRISDCTLVVAASDEMHADMVRRVIADGGMRGSNAKRLYEATLTAPLALARTSGRRA